MKIERLITNATSIVQKARAKLRSELGTPEQMKADAKRAVERLREAVTSELAGGPEYDEDDNTVYPSGAQVLAEGGSPTSLRHVSPAYLSRYREAR